MSREIDEDEELVEEVADDDFENFHVEFGNKPEETINLFSESSQPSQRSTLSQPPSRTEPSQLSSQSQPELFDDLTQIRVETSALDSVNDYADDVDKVETIVRPEVKTKKRGRPKVIKGKSAHPSVVRKTQTHTNLVDKRVTVQEGAKPPVMNPAHIISEYKKQKLTSEEAFDALIRYRINSMLPRPSEKMHYNKDGEISIPKGYKFGRSRDSTGKPLKRQGLTRIEREIMAYQKSTHMLIPRAIFARIVREIAQSWWAGSGQIRFTVEALAALQVATEDEITKLLEISTACSHHAKRITLRVDDMRLARFCRGRQEYEFSNILP
ncbi:histone h3-like, putative [Theileria annulata]|uniref:Histone h3-like, putative n=1 Tax=Theileria annulata TaxID=5874 RepID=Q4UDB1_THEAN|nr:histone h3-like, putative [Theileria annulata]CAI74928.1 histone h3-like, putative [Theileria annulata]|eukprot:XP_952660.1 histone h3-like, putative [Theileria annulata]